MLHDLWYAIRQLRARPWHSLTVIGIFAVGCGAALTVFRMADAILLRSLPYRAADRLVRVSMHLPIAPNDELPFSDVGFRAMEKRNRSFEMTAGYRLAGVNLTRGNTPQRVLSARVTGNFFDVLGMAAQRGRLFKPGEESQKGPLIIVLSDALWRKDFSAAAGAIGTTVRVDGAPATIVGVADPRVTFPAANVDYYTLLDLDPVGTAPFNLGLDLLARVRRGVSVDAALKDASRVIQEVSRENPGPHATPASDYSGFRAVIRPIRDDIAGGVKPTLALLTAAVAFVLCLTCVNVATLELVRSSARRTELAVRSALGAARHRLIAGALAEGAIQATIGGVLGLALSALTVRVLESLAPAAFGAGIGTGVSAGTGAAAVMMILICTGACGFFPIAATLDADVQSALRNRASTTKRLVAVRRALLVTQLSFACILVYGATLMIATVRNAQRVTLGFRPSGLVVFNLSLPRESYARPKDVATTYMTIVDRLRAIPGVASVALASNVPLDADHDAVMVGVEGRPFRADGTDPNVDQRVISAGYFDTMGMSVIAGRAFREGDAYLDGTPVVISKSMAQLLWPDSADPLGHRVRTGPYAPWMTIVGVVSDAKNRSLTLPSRAELYLPFAAPRSPVGVSREMTFVVRAAGSPASVQMAAQRAVLETNPDLPLYRLRRYEDVVARSQIREVATMRTLAAFAAIALALSIAGSYAMLMFAVVQRTRELALRQALGATARDIVVMVGREVGGVLILGIGLGIGGALLASKVLSRFLFEVSALDPLVVATTLCVVAVAGFGAALLPARRASTVDPMLVLRGEG